MPNDERARAYQKLHNKFYFFTLFLEALLLLLFFTSGLSGSLKTWLQNIISTPFWLNGAYFLVFSIGFYLVQFPLQYLSGFHWEHKFQLSNQTFGQWMWDEIKGGLLGLALGFILLEVIYLFLGRFPEYWWIWAGCFWLLFSFVLAKLTPNFIIPLFYKYQPINNPSLRDRIFKLFASCRVFLKDVYAINMSAKTKKANAFLCGMGQSRRVVLSDTLLDEFSDDEIEVVIAHELGHLKHADILKMLFVQAVVVFLGLYAIAELLKKALIHAQLKSIDDISFLPVLLLAFMIFSFVLQPVLNAYSRMVERMADRYSLEKTSNANAFITLMTKLGQMNLSDFYPSRFIEIFLYDHPPIGKRIAMAREHLRTK